ncbi:hypothetical protein [Dyadobacter psychrophilus]|uniref:Lipocalin-like domain-containing protein n=1 Tax=Dyadobacter psychrophilus TaxID=651661 RepID=A0A1T5DLJ7_9BACT|nr:hypothetical protein [Dyadobacter psychrophilus]SKB72373.1 hypothetical protein SAMN05660293_01704 [Dyadobacter psychrophilus]
MLVKKAALLGLISIFLIQISACKDVADSPADTAALLTAVKQWKIDEIAVNDAVTFKDGKMTQQFGGIDFERYMETVELRKDGTFSGVFKGDTKPFNLKWKQNDKNLTVGAADAAAKGGEWTIDPKDASSDFFTMKTQSTAYDYPRMTNIALKFKAVK